MKGKITTVAALLVGVLGIVFGLIAMSGQKKIAYFDYAKVHEGCDLRERLENDLERVVSSRKSELDSLQLELSFLSNKVKSTQANEIELIKFEDLKNRYLTFQNKYEEENYRLKEEYFNQIRTNINDKAKSFGEDKGLSYFLSATGDGAVMYAAESEDVTKEFLEYVNR